MSTRIFGILGLILLAACSRESEQADVQPREEIEPIAVANVAAIDELGGFDESITGISFWRHPNLAFESLMIVASGSNLTSYDIEDGVSVNTVSLASPTGVSVSYQGSGADAVGVVATVDQASSQLEFFTVDNIDRTFQARETLFDTPDAITGFCLGRQNSTTDIALHILRAGEIVSYDLAISDAGIRAETPARIEVSGALIDCVVDDLTGVVFAISSSGEVYRVEEGATSLTPFIETGATSSAAIGLSFSGLNDQAPTDECCGQLAVLNSDDGNIYLYDRHDGHALGRVQITASFDVAAVTSATVMGLGYGNFGGAYRGGVLVVATADTPPVLRLAPWNGILNAITQPIGTPANPRVLSPQSEEDPAAISLEILEP